MQATSNVVEACSALLAELGYRLAVAESMTAGQLMATFALSRKASGVLLGGIVCYDAGIKVQLLQVPRALIEAHTPESAEVTQAMAENLSLHFPEAEVRIAVTGLARPGGSETAEKPLGTVFFHVIVPGQQWALREQFSGSATEIVEAAIECVAQFLIDLLSPHPVSAS